MPNTLETDKNNLKQLSKEKLWVLVYYTNEVFFDEKDKLNTNSLKLDEFLENNCINKDKLLKVRFFNKNGELLIWKSKNDIFKYRIIFDGEKASENSFDREYFTWGNKIEGDYIKEESRDIKIKLPKSLVKNRKNELKYAIRNYFAYDSDGLIYFTDYRLVDLKLTLNQ